MMSVPKWLLVQIIGAFLCFSSASAAESVYAQVTKYTLDSNNISVSQLLPNGIYGAFCSTSSFSGVIMPLTLTESCTLLSPAANVSGSFVALVPRGNCTFLDKALSASSRGATGMIVQDSAGAVNLVVMGAAVLMPFPCIAVDFASGNVLLTGLNPNVTVSPLSSSDEQDNIPLYTKTAIFAILCILVVFVLFIYCQSSVRHYLAVNAFRMHQRQLEEQNVALQQRATARIQELPIVEYRHDGASGDRTVCAICLEELQDEMRVRKLPCSHLYHIACIDPWLVSNRTCPLCKADILTPDGNANAHVAVPISPAAASPPPAFPAPVALAAPGSTLVAATIVLPGSVATTPEPERRQSMASSGSSPAGAGAAPAAGLVGHFMPMHRVSGVASNDSRTSADVDQSELSSSQAAAAAAALGSAGSSAFFYPPTSAPSAVFGLVPSTSYAGASGAGPAAGSSQ